MRLRVKLFAMLREHAGADHVEIEVADGATVADAFTALAALPGLGIIERLPTRMAVNREYADPALRLGEGDELALIPPVSGGSPEVRARVTEDPLDVGALSREVSRPGAGAIVTFQGTTRDVERLEYEAYREMAAGKIERILAECVERHGLEAAVAEHRMGGVPLGEPSVVVAVAAAHRSEAFSGAREVIDRVKAEAPIWKREVEGSAERWVDGEVPG